MLSLINVSLSPPSSLSNTNLKRKEFYFWSEYRLDLHGRVGSWHGDLDQGLMATLQEHGFGIEAQETSLSSLGPQEDCPALCHPPRWPVSRGHRGRGAGEPGCSWVRGLGVAALKGPQRPILPHTTQQGSERAVPLSRVTQQVSGSWGPGLRAPTSQPGLVPGCLQPRRKRQTPSSGGVWEVAVGGVFGTVSSEVGQEDSWAGRGFGPPAISTSATRWRQLLAYLTIRPWLA